MSCKKPENIETRIICATFCNTPPTQAPKPSFIYNDGMLVDSSQYFDEIYIGEREAQWVISIEDLIIYRFGYGELDEEIIELTNGSTYSNLILGYKNQDIINFLESLPNTIITPDIEYTISLNVKDTTGTISVTKSNLYKFIKL